MKDFDIEAITKDESIKGNGFISIFYDHRGLGLLGYQGA
jgi:hypothetical protein